MENKHDKISGEEALKRLLDGNKRFINKKFIHRDFEEERKETASGQNPFAIVLSCIDSRVPTEIIFDQGIGDVFNLRIAGNVISDDVLGSLEFACGLSGTPLIFVLGHTSCGAVKGACDHVEYGNLTGLLKKIYPAIKLTETSPGESRKSDNLKFVNNVAIENVRLSMQEILDKSEIVKEKIDANEVLMVGGMYDISSGKVEMI